MTAARDDEEALGTVAARGVGILVLRTVGLQLLTAGVTIALARILTPGDYGIFAIASAAQLLGLRLAEMGIAAALLRRPQEPSEAEQKATLTLFLSVGLVICAIAFVLAFAVLPWSGLEEEGAKAVAICLLAIPIYACRSVPLMLMERQLRFGRVALVETGETLAFNAFALTAAVAGLGAYSLAAAVPVAAIAGTAAAWSMQPFARGLTRHLAPVRPLIRFGLGLTTLQLVNLGGSLVFVSVLTAAGGASLAGFYALAQRLFAFPTALTSALLRVSFPALSRGEAAERARRAGRAAILGTVVVGLPLALVAGAADPLIEVLFGERWLPVADLVILGSIGMMLITAAVVPMTSLSLAQGRPALPVGAAAAQFLLLVGGAALVGGLGSAEVGALLAAGAAVNVVVLAAGTDAAVRRALRWVLLGLVLSAVAAGAGRLIGGSDVAALVASAAVTGIVWLALTLVFMRGPAAEIWGLARPYMRRLRPAVLPAVLAVAIAGAAALALSGGQSDGPRTPAGIPGVADPFLGVAVVGSGGLSAAVDSYGTVVDLRIPGPAGEAQIAIAHERQKAGTVPPRSGLVVAAGAGGDGPTPAWRADAARQHYLPRSNVLRTTVRTGGANLTIVDAAAKQTLLRRFIARGPGVVRVRLTADFDLVGSPAGDEIREGGGRLRMRDGRRKVICDAVPAPAIRAVTDPEPRAELTWRAKGVLRARLDCTFGGAPQRGRSPREVAAADRRWLAGSTPLAAGAPAWARAMYERSLLVLRALTDARTGAMAAGLREAWSYVWPRDAATTALALEAAGHRDEATRIARFLTRLELSAGARFLGDGSVVADGRVAQGDAGGWVNVARRAAGLSRDQPAGPGWRGRPDYGERSGDDGDYVANAIAAGVGAERIASTFAGARGTLVRRAHEPGSELDSAVAWAVRPFPRPALFGSAEHTLDAVGETAGPFGVEPHTRWPGEDPWTAPTAWVAWADAALGRRGAALAHVERLRRAATPAGLLPERVDADSGLPSSTTPLGWSHAFAVLVLSELFSPVRSG